MIQKRSNRGHFHEKAKQGVTQQGEKQARHSVGRLVARNACPASVCSESGVRSVYERIHPPEIPSNARSIPPTYPCARPTRVLSEPEGLNDPQSRSYSEGSCLISEGKRVLVGLTREDGVPLPGGGGGDWAQRMVKWLRTCGCQGLRKDAWCTKALLAPSKAEMMQTFNNITEESLCSLIFVMLTRRARGGRCGAAVAKEQTKEQRRRRRKKDGGGQVFVAQPPYILVDSRNRAGSRAVRYDRKSQP
jgi:hypothetical protein